jgi:zinc transporter, ZIP family
VAGAFWRPPWPLVAAALALASGTRINALLLAVSVVACNVVLWGASEELLALLLAFAGGAVLASLADTLMPDAYREGGGLVAFATAAGFFPSFMVDKV